MHPSRVYAVPSSATTGLLQVTANGARQCVHLGRRRTTRVTGRARARQRYRPNSAVRAPVHPLVRPTPPDTVRNGRSGACQLRGRGDPDRTALATDGPPPLRLAPAALTAPCPIPSSGSAGRLRPSSLRTPSSSDAACRPEAAPPAFRPTSEYVASPKPERACTDASIQPCHASAGCLQPTISFQEIVSGCARA
jgi:hypothetical protein